MCAVSASPIESSNAALFAAHPGHELLVLGWVGRVKPRVYTLTDGSGSQGRSRLRCTAELLQSVGAPTGSSFGRLTDQEAYTAILDGDTGLIDALVVELAGDLQRHNVSLVVADAAEGFNPVHDLCRLIVGAAASRVGSTGASIRHYEYPLDAGPAAYEQGEAGVVFHDLDDASFSWKIAAARELAAAIPDINAMLDRFGEASFRRETFRVVEDWAAGRQSAEPPLYEKFGEERVSAGRYDRVIRYSEHMWPILQHLRASCSRTACAS